MEIENDSYICCRFCDKQCKNENDLDNHFFENHTSDLDNERQQDLKIARQEVLDVIYNNKKMSSIYIDHFPNDIEIDYDNFIIEKHEPFIWICSKEKQLEMQMMIYAQKHRKYNPYFNGYMYGYSDDKIYDFYKSMYPDKFNEYFIEDKTKNNTLINELQNLVSIIN